MGSRGASPGPPLLDRAPSAGPVRRARAQGTGEPLPFRLHGCHPPSGPFLSLFPTLPSLWMPSHSTWSHGSKESVESQDTLAPAEMRVLQVCRATPGFPDPEDWWEIEACQDNPGDKEWW